MVPGSGLQSITPRAPTGGSDSNPSSSGKTGGSQVERSHFLQYLQTALYLLQVPVHHIDVALSRK